MLDNDTEIPDLKLSDVLLIMNDSFGQLMKEMNEQRTIMLSMSETIDIISDVVMNLE